MKVSSVQGVVKGRRCTHDQVYSEQTSSSPHQTLPSAESVDDLSRDDCADDTDCVETTCKSVLLDCRVASLLEQDWTVGSHSSDTCGIGQTSNILGRESIHTSPRGHNLQPDTQPSSATQMSALTLVKSKQNLDELDWRSRLGVLSHSHNLVEFFLDGFRICRSTNAIEDFTGFVVSTHRGEVARGIR